MIYYSHSPEETFSLGEKLGRKLSSGGVICFFGDLASGKTTLIKGLIHAGAEITPEKVSSPTFVLLNIYEGKQTVYHFDLYRLNTPEEFFHLGFEEYWKTPGICCMEWSERIEKFLPENAVIIRMKALEEAGKREIVIEGIDDLEKN